MAQKVPYLDFIAATTLKIESNTTARTLTGLDSTYTEAVRADIFVDVSPIRYGFNYTPAATTGHALDQQNTLTLYGYGEMKRFQHITGGATDAQLFCTYKYPQGSK